MPALPWDLARSYPLKAPNGIDGFPHFAEMAKLAISVETPIVRGGPDEDDLEPAEVPD